MLVTTMVNNLEFKRIDENTIGFSYTEEVVKEGQKSEEEFNNMYADLEAQRLTLETEMQTLNNKRHTLDIQLNSYEAFKDSEETVEEEPQEE